jgi:hypothetical protein
METDGAVSSDRVEAIVTQLEDAQHVARPALQALRADGVGLTAAEGVGSSGGRGLGSGGLGPGWDGGAGAGSGLSSEPSPPACP